MSVKNRVEASAYREPTTERCRPDRNRPKRFGERTAASPQGADQLAALVRAGMDPNEVAEKVMHGIKENELYIFSHPEWRSTLEEHFQRMLVACTVHATGASEGQPQKYHRSDLFRLSGLIWRKLIKRRPVPLVLVEVTMLPKPEPAYFAIADISGYTSFLAGVELDHAQDIIADLMDTVVKGLRPPFRLAKFEGDAAFVYAVTATAKVDGSMLQDTIE